MTCHLPGLLLVALLFVSGGHSLKCYSCKTNTNNTACNAGGPTACSATSQDTCMTNLIYKGSSYAVSKQCSTKVDCEVAKILEGTIYGAGTLTTCCQSDGCNVNAAPRPLGAAHVTLALLGVAISVVVSRALM